METRTINIPLDTEDGSKYSVKVIAEKIKEVYLVIESEDKEIKKVIGEQ